MKKEFFPALDIVRAILSIVVLYSHTVPEYSFDVRFAGSYAVMFFFTISGFLLAYLATQEYNATNDFNVKKFYYRRIMRIWPSYFLFILITCGTMYIWRAPRITDMLLSMVFLGNLKNSFYLILTSYHTDDFFRVTWSLCVEEQFYLFFPMFIVLLIKSEPMKNIKRLGVILIICSLIRYCVLWYGKSKGLSIYPGVTFQTTSYVDMIFLAVLLGIYRDRLAKWFSSKKAVYASIAVIAVWFAATMHYFFWACDYKTGFAYWYPVTAVVSGISVVCFSFVKYDKPGAFVKTMIYLGKLSYGIYLFHTPIHSVLIVFRVFPKDSALMFPTVLLLTIIFSHFVYAYFEKWFRRVSRERYAVSMPAATNTLPRNKTVATAPQVLTNAD